VRPRLECLEDRTLPALITWTGAVSDDWNTPGNWKPNTVPGPNDDAVINAPGATITVGPTTRATVSGLDLEGGTLAVGDRLTVSQTFTWSGGTLQGPGAVDNEGYLSITGPDAKTLDGVVLDNFGIADWNGGDVEAGGGAAFDNRAVFVADTAARFEPDFHNSGLFLVDAGGSGADLGFLDNSGGVFLEGNHLHADFFVQTDGWTDLGGGTLHARHRVDVWGGELRGPGTVDADLLNAAHVSTGGGTLSVAGNYTQTAGGRLDATLGRTPADPHPLHVDGTASLGGTLALSFEGGFHSRPPATFSVLTAGSVAGRFDSVEGLPGGTQIAYAPNAVLLQQPLPPSPPRPPRSGGGGLVIGTDPAGIHDVVTDLERDAEGPTLPTAPESGPLLLALVQEINPAVVTAVPQQPAALRPENASALSGGDSTGYRAARSPAPTGSGGTQEAPPVVVQNAVDPRLLVPPDLDPPPLEGMLSAGDIAGALLTGGRPRADVLPQKGSAVASVATLLADDGAAAGGAPPRGDGGGELPRLLIDPTAPANAPPAEAPPGLRPLVILGAGALALRDRRKRAHLPLQNR
jgi:hypothetical protein